MLGLLLLASATPAQDFRIIDAFAGGTNGDGGSATNANLRPLGVAVDAAGNVYFADILANKIRKVSPSGVVTAIAGTGQEGATGDGGPGVYATLRRPSDVDVDANGNVYIADRGNHKIRVVDGKTGIIRTVAGNGSSGFSGDGGQAVNARLNSPTSVVVEDGGTFFISDTSNNRIRQVSPNGVIQSFGPANLGTPWGIELDRDGHVYFIELLNQRVRVINRSTQQVSTFAGTGLFGLCNNVPALSTCFRNPTYLAYDSAQDAFLVADSGNHVIRRVPRVGGLVTTVAGDGFGAFSGDGGLAILARFNGPGGIAVHPNLGMLIGDEFNYRIRRVTPGGIVSTYAGNGNLPFGGDGEPAIAAKLNGPSAITVDAAGNIYFTDTQNQRVRRIDLAGIITTVAGTGASGFSGDGGQATAATLKSPDGIALDRLGNIYISDTSNHRVRRVAANGVITTFLGTGTGSSTGDNGPATSATVNRPGGLAVYENASGSQRYLYVCEPSSSRVRRVDLNTNTVTRFAGTGDFGFSGDNGPATSAKLNLPVDVATDANGNVYIADAGNNRVRRVTNGTISTFAGNGQSGYSGDGGSAAAASLSLPKRVTVGPAGEVYISDSGNMRVRVVTTDSRIRTAVGTGRQTGSIDGEGGNPLDDLGNGNPATEASFTSISGIAADSFGNVYLSDADADTLRWVADLATLFGFEPGGVGAISGSIRHAITNAPIAGVEVEFFGPARDIEVTGSTGGYANSNLPLGNWTVAPKMEGGFEPAAISPLDAAYVLQALVNSRTLTSAQELACDVTGDGLSALDATRIMQRWLGSQTPFPAAEMCGSDWLFIPDASPAGNQTELTPVLSGSSCRMGAIEFSPLTGQSERQDFVGVVIGDCTGNWRSGASGAALSAMSGSAEGATVRFDLVSSRKRVRVPISIDGDLDFQALEVRLGYDSGIMRPTRAVSRGRARNAIVRWSETSEGELLLAMASGTPISTPARSIVVVEFELVDSKARPGLRSAQARIDEGAARVVVNQRANRRR